MHAEDGIVAEGAGGGWNTVGVGEGAGSEGTSIGRAMQRRSAPGERLERGSVSSAAGE